jgi:hypothetical protein
MILVRDALQALECTECSALIEIDRAVSEDAELRVRWMEHVTREHEGCGMTDLELAKARKKKLHRYRPMRGQF